MKIRPSFMCGLELLTVCGSSQNLLSVVSLFAGFGFCFFLLLQYFEIKLVIFQCLSIKIFNVKCDMYIFKENIKCRHTTLSFLGHIMTASRGSGSMGAKKMCLGVDLPVFKFALVYCHLGQGFHTPCISASSL